MNIPVCFRGVSGRKYKLVRQDIKITSISNAVCIALEYKLPVFCNAKKAVYDFKNLCKYLSQCNSNDPCCEWSQLGWANSDCKTYSVFCSFVAGQEIHYFETVGDGGEQCS